MKNLNKSNLKLSGKHQTENRLDQTEDRIPGLSKVKKKKL
jgi:hypothetical protein